MRHAIVYVIKNFEKHPVAIPDRGTEPQDGIDPLSSARWFAGWHIPPPTPPEASPACDAHTWLARTGWRRAGGAIQRHERPRIRPA